MKWMNSTFGLGLVVFDKDGGSGGGGGDDDDDDDDADDEDEDADDEDEDEDEDEDAQTVFDEWLAEQPEETQEIYKKQTTGLVNALHSERDISKGLKKQMPEYKKLLVAEKKRLEAEQSETEKLQGSLDEATAAQEVAETELANTKKRHAIIVEAGKLNFIDSEEALKLIGLDNVNIDEDGKVTEIEKKVKELAKKKPHLIKSEGTGDNLGNHTRQLRKNSDKKKKSKKPTTSGIRF